ncbi:hypothetical protein WJ45_16075 [Burkholderia ubonensis]|nr:hypothetical protein WJ45_16075 [Burkholderia ubonensis]
MLALRSIQFRLQGLHRGTVSCILPHHHCGMRQLGRVGDSLAGDHSLRAVQLANHLGLLRERLHWQVNRDLVGYARFIALAMQRNFEMMIRVTNVQPTAIGGVLIGFGKVKDISPAPKHRLIEHSGLF